MPATTTSPVLFGDILALARESWVREMSTRLAERGYPDYRRADPLVLRWLVHGTLPFGRLTSVLGVSRQSARKVISGLVERHYAHVRADETDSRRRNVELTPWGRDYASAVIEVLSALNREIAAKVNPDQLEAAQSVLGYVKDNFGL